MLRSLRKHESLIRFREGEALIETVDLYWTSFFPKWVLWLVILLLLLVLLYVWSMPVFRIVYLISLIPLLFWGFREYVRSRLTNLLITNHRLIHISQDGFFTHTVSEVHYDRVQSISFQVKGFFSSLFNMGTIRVQTGMTRKSCIKLEFILNPHELQDQIVCLREAYLRSYGGGKVLGMGIPSAEAMNPGSRRSGSVEKAGEWTDVDLESLDE